MQEDKQGKRQTSRHTDKEANLWKSTEGWDLLCHGDDPPDAQFGNVDQVRQVGVVPRYVAVSAHFQRVTVSHAQVVDGGCVLAAQRNCLERLRGHGRLHRSAHRPRQRTGVVNVRRIVVVRRKPAPSQATTRKSQHSQECKDPLMTLTFGSKINGFPGPTVEHLYVTFGEYRLMIL